MNLERSWERLTDDTETSEMERVETVEGFRGEESRLNRVTIPADIDPPEATRPERCAFILRLMIEAGMPDILNKTELSEFFDISRKRIYTDIDEMVEPAIGKSIGQDHAAVSKLVYRKAIKELLVNEDYEEATRVVQRWNEWLTDRGFATKEPDKLELSSEEEDLVDELF